MFKCKPVSPEYWGLKIDSDDSGGSTSTEVTLEDGRTVDIVWADQFLDTDADDDDVAADDFVLWRCTDDHGNAVHTPEYQYVAAEDIDNFHIVG